MAALEELAQGLQAVAAGRQQWYPQGPQAVQELQVQEMAYDEHRRRKRLPMDVLQSAPDSMALSRSLRAVIVFP